MTRPATIATLLAAAMVAALASSLVAQHWRTAVAGPEMILLGSGSQLSVLIRAGEARLLLAAGDDNDAFDRAYGRVQRPTTPRLDLMIVVGDGRSLVVPEALASRDAARQMLALRPIGVDQRSGSLAAAAAPVVRQRRDVRLPDGMIVSVDPYPDHRDPGVWTITVSHRTTRLLIVPNAEAITLARGTAGISSLVVLGKAEVETLRTTRSRSVVVHGDHAEDVIRASEDDLTASSEPWIWIVHDSEALIMSFGDGQLRIPSEDARYLATMRHTTSAPLPTPELDQESISSSLDMGRGF